MTAEAEEAFVRITLREVYNEVVQMRQDIALFVPQVPDHEARIRTVERWMYAVPATLITSIAAIIVAWRK